MSSSVDTSNDQEVAQQNKAKLDDDVAMTFSSDPNDPSIPDDSKDS